jgi:4-amino-4-deoxy-L-arabinose transferase-like glycosyltransferase
LEIRKDKSVYLFIMLLWVVATAINLNKPFHIDDTFHLEVAQWIAHHPLQPMSGMVNWTDVPEPIHHFNQPPVYLYIVALSGVVFGFSEIPLHLVQSLFTLIAILFFFRISRLVCPANAKFLTLLLAFCPAFIVNQNLMTDVPVTALSLVFIWLLITPSLRSDTLRYSLAGLILGLAVLTKYTVLPLLVVLAISLFWRREYRRLWVLLIPLGMIGLWSLWNIHEFGYPHIAGRTRDDFGISDFLETSLSFMACLGAIAPFLPVFLRGMFRPHRSVTIAVFSGFLLFCLFATASWFGLITPNLSKEIIRYLFLLNGMILVVIFFFLAVKRYLNRSSGFPFGHTEAVIFFWFAGITGFIIQFAPFIGTRHILLTVPPLLLAGSWVAGRIPLSLKVLTAASAIALGLLLGISDWFYADFYRKGASEVKSMTEGTARTWTAGHWGWQWYSEKQGMMQYGTGSGEIRTGDLLVIPAGIASQKIDSSLQLVPVRKIWQKAGPFTFFSTAYNAAFYMSTYLHPAWRFSRDPVDTIMVYKVLGHP